jgi:hypothetical protein
MEQRTHIEFRPFRCPAGHEFAATCKRITRADLEPDVLYRSAGLSAWLPVPKCPRAGCGFSGEPVRDPRSSRAPHAAMQVPESERLQVWLSPDGARVSVPGYRGAQMPERYRRAGYVTFDAYSLADFDRLDRARARQTGNEVYNEVTSYDRAARRTRQQAEYSEELTTDY